VVKKIQRLTGAPYFFLSPLARHRRRSSGGDAEQEKDFWVGALLADQSHLPRGQAAWGL
jgi:hypothetical protein